MLIVIDGLATSSLRPIASGDSSTLVVLLLTPIPFLHLLCLLSSLFINAIIFIIIFTY